MEKMAWTFTSVLLSFYELSMKSHGYWANKKLLLSGKITVNVLKATETNHLIYCHCGRMTKYWGYFIPKLANVCWTNTYLSMQLLPCSVLITIANRLNPDQAQQKVGPDQDSNCLTLLNFSTTKKK